MRGGYTPTNQMMRASVHHVTSKQGSVESGLSSCPCFCRHGGAASPFHAVIRRNADGRDTLLQKFVAG